jgi:hypothetical protein
VSSLLLFRLLALVGGWEEVGEKFQGNWEQKLCERYYDEDGKWDESSKILYSALQLSLDVSIASQ